MLYVIVILGCIIGFAIQCYNVGYDGILDALLGGALGALIGIAMSIIIVLPIHCAIDCYADRADTKTAEHTICALADNAALEGRVNGNVFLASGYVNENLKYGYMYRVENRGYGYDSVPAEYSYINRTTETPHVEAYDIYYKNPIVRFLFPCVDNDEYVFYLPEEAQITNEYIIDLK